MGIALGVMGIALGVTGIALRVVATFARSSLVMLI